MLLFRRHDDFQRCAHCERFNRLRLDDHLIRHAWRTGVVAGTVLNTAFVAPGLGTLLIGGDYAEIMSTGLTIQITSINAYSKLAVNGSATPGGTLSVVTTGYAPTTNDVFTILTASNGVTTQHSSFILPPLSPSTLGWNLQYLSNSIVLSVTGAPPASGYGMWAGAITNGMTNYTRAPQATDIRICSNTPPDQARPTTTASPAERLAKWRTARAELQPQHQAPPTSR